MDRIVEVKVNGNYITKDNKNAGAQGECNMTALRIEFDEGWDGFAKTITWWNARHQNPVQRTLTADQLEDITNSTRIYVTLIPGEPLEYSGMCRFVIDGYSDDKRQRSLQDELYVKPVDRADDAGDPVDPTPTQAEQLQVQIEALLPTIQADKAAAQEAAAQAEAGAADAASHALQAQETADAIAAEVQADVDRAQAAADEAEAQKTLTAAQAILAKEEADKAADSAESAEAAAKVAEECAARADQIAGGDFVTPTDMAKAKQEAIEEAQESLNVHATNKSNPHGVTAAQVGAVAKAGDTMKGNLNISPASGESFVGLTCNATEREVYLTNATDKYAVFSTRKKNDSNNRNALWLAPEDVADIKNLLRINHKVNGAANTYRLYGEHNKPTPAGIGAVAKAGDTMTGGLNFHPAGVTGYTQMYKNATSDSADYGTLMIDRASAGKMIGLKLYAAAQKAIIFDSTSEYDLYHAGNKPTAADIQAGTLAAGVKASTGTDYTTMRLRNIMAQTSDVTAGTTGLSNGNIILVYE